MLQTAYAEYIKQTKMSLFDKILLASNDLTNAIENASCGNDEMSPKRISLNIEARLKELAKDAQSKTKEKVEVLRSSKETAVRAVRDSRKERISREDSALSTDNDDEEYVDVANVGEIEGRRSRTPSLCIERSASCKLCSVM